MAEFKIYLIGFMGCGKTYTGQRLAARLRLDFLDLDQWIEEQTGRGISDIFRQDGEPAFRQMEREFLRKLENKTNLLVATGGGTPCYHENMSWMCSNGLVIYLKASPGILLHRLTPVAASRPLLAHLSAGELHSYIERKLAERVPFYESAHLVFEQFSGEEDSAVELGNYLKRY
jgi:shikimate kinase